MNKLPLFEDFIPLGFASHDSARYTLGNFSNIKTGYNMNAIVGPVMELGKCILEQAHLYEYDNDPNHTAKDYINEVKNHINQKLDEVCEKYYK
jgi:hypothetical protein